MERLTNSESIEVLCALKDRVAMAWHEAIDCHGYNERAGFEFWVRTAAVSWNAWNKVVEWPWVPDELDEEQFQEPYEPIYQEPDSF